MLGIGSIPSESTGGEALCPDRRPALKQTSLFRRVALASSVVILIIVALMGASPRNASLLGLGDSSTQSIAVRAVSSGVGVAAESSPVAAWGPARFHVSGAMPDPSPQRALYAIWERAQRAGGYTFVADVEQILIPRPVPSMIGRADQRIDMRLQGEVTLPDYARLTLRFEGAGSSDAPFEIVQDGADSYLVKDGDRVPVEYPAGLASPTADYLGYLAGRRTFASSTARWV
jgi:hypothetical protein